MNWTSLGEPVPRTVPARFEASAWPAGEQTLLPAYPQRTLRPFEKVALHRRTRYDFAPISLEDLAFLFDLTQRVQQISKSVAFGFPPTQRPVPSAGALHPISVVVHRMSASCWERYDPFAHALVALTSSLAPNDVRSALREVVEPAQAAVVLLVAEPMRTAAKYENPESLIWRDAGVLIGAMALAAEALDLSFVPLGVTAETWASQLMPERSLHGVGAALLGARSCP